MDIEQRLQKLENFMRQVSDEQLSYPLDGTSQDIIFSHLLDYFTSGGFLPPSYTTAVRDTLSPQPGFLIFNSTSSKLNFYTGSAWKEITSA